MNEAITAPPPIKRRVLSYSEKIRLGNWLDENIESLRQQRATRAEAAERASTDLQFVVTEGNIKGVEDAMGLSFLAPKVPPLTGDQFTDILARLQSAQEALNETTRLTVESNTRMDLRLSTAFRDLATLKQRVDSLVASLRGQGFNISDKEGL